ncbi:hypothetical protein CEXT_24771 [Caerostris extrusa]|uniref:Uncharacterized protein n=1 Tax=Caerostris extrusa TaxID=172846 RepID=A0AAV4UVB1_CAEEX|nr:hypothetical protein CEXT_24771 [Caerostris extrusa]
MGKASHAQSKRQLPKTNEGYPSSRLIDGGIHSSREKPAEFEEEEANILSIKSRINSDYFALIFECGNSSSIDSCEVFSEATGEGFESLFGSAEAFSLIDGDVLGILS